MCLAGAHVRIILWTDGLSDIIVSSYLHSVGFCYCFNKLSLSVCLSFFHSLSCSVPLFIPAQGINSLEWIKIRGVILGKEILQFGGAS